MGLLSTFVLLCLPPSGAGAKEQGQEAEVVVSQEVEGEERCVQKVVLEERSVVEEVEQCTHSLHTSCHTTYVTGKYLPLVIFINQDTIVMVRLPEEQIVKKHYLLF